MSFKWDENSTFIFLNAYRKHPCLWNPHHVKYYNCLAKNEALKNIIKELSIPELNISDCLEQIKVIREKYGQEQIRVINGFQSRKPYKSPFAWFPVISGMLTKVIDNESKLQNRMKSVKTISPDILKDCITTAYDKYKNISNFPCVQETRQDHKTKPRNNTKFTKTGNLDILDNKSERQNDARLLQCPSCGWEDIKPDRLDATAKKTYEQIKPFDIAVPCPEYSSLVDKPYEKYRIHRHQVAENIYQERYNNIIPCSSFPSSLPSYTGYPADVLTSHTYRPQGICNYINQQTTPEAIVTSKPKFCTRETQLSSEQLFPERRTKQVGTSVEQHDKGIQNTVCVSKTNADIARKSHKEIQSKPSVPQEELRQVAVNTVERHDKEIQNTICSLSDCQAFQKCSSTREAKQIDANTVECPANDMRNTIGIKLKTVEGSMPNFILITTDGNYLPLIQRAFKLKELTTDRCQKDTGDLYQDQKEEKARLALDGKNLVENEVCMKETCSRDIMEIIKRNSAVTQALLQCLEKILQEKTKMHSLTSVLSKRDNVDSNSSEGSVCEQIPRKFANGSTYSATSSTIEFESLSCLSGLEKTEKDNTIAMFTKTFLELMKHALVLNSKNVQQSCVKKENAIDTFIVLNKIKECAEEILKIYALADCSKRQLLNKFCSRSKLKGKCPSKPSSALSSIQTQDVERNATDKFTASYANSKDVEVLYGPSTSKNRDHSLSENCATYVKTTMEERSSVEDKEITARSENHDIGLNASLPQVSLHDSGTQYTPKQLQDTGVVTEREQGLGEKISVATQNREPILIRVIKSNNSEGILKLDKETCVRDAHVVWMTNVDKFSKNMYQKYSVREYYDELLHPGVSHVREKEVNCIDYRTSNRIYGYDKRCRSSLPRSHNWIKANKLPNLGLSSSQRVSRTRIPLYAKSRKYTRRRTDLYRISRS